MSKAIKSIGALAAGIIAFAVVSTVLAMVTGALLASPAPPASGQPPVPMETMFFVVMVTREMLTGAALGLVVALLAPARPVTHVAAIAIIIAGVGAATLLSQSLPTVVLIQDLCLPAATAVGALAATIPISRSARFGQSHESSSHITMRNSH